MHTPQTRASAKALMETGVSLNRTSQQLGVNRATLRAWRAAGWPEDGGRASWCFRCRPEPAPPPDEAQYAYLLGQYLGDGCLSAHARGVHALRIACCAAYPGIMDECQAAIESTSARSVFRVAAPGCFQVTAYWKHWPCVFPQHGPGRKHTRAIVLEPWQEAVVDAHPGRFLRGLVHSDGCRVANWATKDGRRYEGYVRYFFSNRSTDILALCCRALDRLGIGWTRPDARTVSVARRADVAVMDRHVGPKS